MKQPYEVIHQVLQSKDHVQIKLLGDSITHGVGGTGFEQNGAHIVEEFSRNPDGYCWAKLFAEFMKEHIGEQFTGTISGMTEWGMYVELDENHVEGMAFLRDIEDDDYYRFDEARYEVVGRSSGRSFTLGTPVRIMVKSVDMRRRTLDFKILI